MKVISYKETEEYIILRLSDNTQAMISNYPQIKDYKNYGFNTIEEMMLEVRDGKIWFDKIQTKEHKIYKNQYSFNTVKINELKQIELKLELNEVLPEDLIFDNYGEFYYWLKDINIKDVFNVNTKYKTKVKVNNLFLNIIDLTKLYLNNYNNYIALNFLADLFEIDIIERDIVSFQEKIIINNLKLNLKDILSKESYNFIENYINVLEKIYNIGLLHLIPITNLRNESVFYFSNRYLAEKTGRTEGSINYIINTFSALGFINKINQKDLQKSFINNARNNKTDEKFYEVSFYSINELTISKIKEIEKNIELMIEKKSSFSKITKQEVKRLFGKEKAEQIFPNVKVKKETIKKRIETKLKENDVIDEILKEI